MKERNKASVKILKRYNIKTFTVNVIQYIITVKSEKTQKLIKRIFKNHLKSYY